MSMFQIFFIRFKYFSSELFWSNRRRMQNQSNCATLYIKWKVGPINWPPFFFPYLMKIHPTRHLVNTMLIINNKLFSERVFIKICMHGPWGLIPTDSLKLWNIPKFLPLKWKNLETILQSKWTHWINWSMYVRYQVELLKKLPIFCKCNWIIS